MQNIRLHLLTSFLLSGLLARSQNSEVIQDYINTYKEIAIAEMQRTGVPASIKLAQGIHETMAGTSSLVLKSNNHFGIKCKSTWTGESVSHDDDLRGECFRKYSSPADSYRDHSNFLKNNQRYASLFKLDPLDYSSWAYGLKKAGYATNPKYPQIIIKLIEDYDLQDYTLVALGKLKMSDEILAKTSETDNKDAIAPAVEVEKNGVPEENKITDLAPIAKQVIYPEGEFKINETRVVYVRKGTSFLTIAQQYNIPLARVFDFNDMDEREAAIKDQLIYLQRKRKTGKNEYHTVLAGETLHDIAQEEAIRMEALLEYNHFQAYMKPAVGVQLYLKTLAPSRPLLAINDVISDEQASFAKNDIDAGIKKNAAQSANSNQEYFTHTVQTKETVYSISKKYGVRMDDITEWNQLNGYELKTGQQLKIYK